MRNTWRLRAGLESIKDFPPTSRKLEAPENIDALIAAVVTAPDEGSRHVAVSELRRHGIAVHKPVESALKELPGEHPAAESLQRLTLQLANTVSEFIVRPATLRRKIDADLLHSVRGKRLTETEYIRILRQLIATLPADLKGVTLAAFRGAEAVGTSLHVTYYSQPDRTQGGQDSWTVHNMVKVGLQPVECSSGSRHREDEWAHDDLRAPIQAALKSSSGTEVVIESTWRLQK